MQNAKDVIREKRLEMGIKQKKFAEILGITPMSYYKKESGLLRFTEKDIKILSSRFNIDFQRLIDESINKED